MCPWPGPSFAEAGKPLGTPIPAGALADLDADGWELYHVAKREGLGGAVAEHAFPLYSLDDAERLRSRILALFEDADRNPVLVEWVELMVWSVRAGRLHPDRVMSIALPVASGSLGEEPQARRPNHLNPRRATAGHPEGSRRRAEHW